MTWTRPPVPRGELGAAILTPLTLGAGAALFLEVSGIQAPPWSLVVVFAFSGIAGGIHGLRLAPRGIRDGSRTGAASGSGLLFGYFTAPLLLTGVQQGFSHLNAEALLASLAAGSLLGALIGAMGAAILARGRRKVLARKAAA